MDYHTRRTYGFDVVDKTYIDEHKVWIRPGILQPTALFWLQPKLRILVDDCANFGIYKGDVIGFKRGVSMRCSFLGMRGGYIEILGLSEDIVCAMVRESFEILQKEYKIKEEIKSAKRAKKAAELRELKEKNAKALIVWQPPLFNPLHIDVLAFPSTKQALGGTGKKRNHDVFMEECAYIPQKFQSTKEYQKEWWSNYRTNAMAELENWCKCNPVQSVVIVEDDEEKKPKMAKKSRGQFGSLLKRFANMYLCCCCGGSVQEKEPLLDTEMH